MGLFDTYRQRDAETPKKAAPAATAATAATAARAQDFTKPSQGKTRPTPTRAQAEAARRDRIRPQLTQKELKARERDADRARRGRTMRDFEMKPERVLMRNYVDSRWTLTEYMWPFLVVFLVLSIVGSGVPEIVIGVTIGLWLLIIAGAINVIVFWRGFKLELRVRYPGAKYQGLLWGMVSRMIAMRRVRQPGVMVERGQSY